jgi:CRP-like cAMP-binding protein
VLRSIPEAEFDRFSLGLDRVCLLPGQVLYEPYLPIEFVYFIETGVASVVGVMSDGSAVETATIGCEGMVGLPLFHGVDRTASQCFCQVPGESWRMRAGDFQEELRRNAPLMSILGRYTEALFIQVAQSSACNRVHAMRARCARWLLQTHDRVGTDRFQLTQRFLAQMLGVRRATVTEAAGSLQDARLIDYKMGTIRILDRQGLEAAACECYLIIRREIERLLEGRESTNPLKRVQTSAHGQSQLTEPTPRSEELGSG